MNNPQYKAIYQQARDLDHRYQDFAGGGHDTHPELIALHHEVRNLIEYIEQEKNPHTLEDHIKVILREIQKNQHQPNPAMHYEHLDHLYDEYEKMRLSLRHFENF